uniref:Uncharacterized protein n=1 Tax=Oncorhynchus tshawytscha TaxID=74940 RepID=A0A8C8D7M2_ONCTS
MPAIQTTITKVHGPRTLLGCGLRWENQFDQPLHFNCPSRQSISYIKKGRKGTKLHNNTYEDRLWGFECKDTFVYEPECHWSPYINDFDQEFTFEFPKNYVLTGMNSYHFNRHEDKVWKCYCCRVNSYCDFCVWGVWGGGDRRWRYQYCTRTSNC